MRIYWVTILTNDKVWLAILINNCLLINCNWIADKIEFLHILILFSTALKTSFDQEKELRQKAESKVLEMEIKKSELIVDLSQLRQQNNSLQSQLNAERKTVHILFIIIYSWLNIQVWKDYQACVCAHTHVHTCADTHTEGWGY